MPSQEDIENQRNLLITHRATLQLLLSQHAQFGAAYVPQHIWHGLRQTRTEIRKCKDVLHGWSEQVEDLPDDEEFIAAATQVSSALHNMADLMHLPAIRSDFETFIARLPQLQPLFEAGRVQVTPLSAAELREAIERRARRAATARFAAVVVSLVVAVLGIGLAIYAFQYLTSMDSIFLRPHTIIRHDYGISLANNSPFSPFILAGFGAEHLAPMDSVF
jgi:hypothetical protein